MNGPTAEERDAFERWMAAVGVAPTCPACGGTVFSLAAPNLIPVADQVSAVYTKFRVLACDRCGCILQFLSAN